ncbi:hypothetical protein [Neobacillus bataviensis]|uniref:hypothetical protein n=1 Tax=Neobacillus bataviensis TaxID=220685 RepID=UPI001CBFDB7E|nr:hypothetical protein [Neobacillus bataviensis]
MGFIISFIASWQHADEKIRRNRKYYEIVFYEAKRPDSWCFYIWSDVPITNEEMPRVLKRDFLGVSGLSQQHIDNIYDVYEITAEQFTSRCGIKA